MTRRLASRVVVSVGLTLDRDVIAVEGEVGGLAEPVRARRLTDQEGRKLQQIVRRGRHESVRVRRALIIMASASGTTVPAIARLVAAHEDTVRDVIHAFNERGLAALDPQWAGGRPRLISSDDEEFIVTAATTRPVKLGRPFTHWSIRKLADYLADNPVRVVKVGRERLRQILRAHGISFQRTRTWKESKDPDKDVKLDRIEEVTSRFPDRCFAFDQFGPLSIRPCHGTCWARRTRPDRLPATYPVQLARTSRRFFDPPDRDQAVEDVDDELGRGAWLRTRLVSRRLAPCAYQVTDAQRWLGPPVSRCLR